MKPNCFKKGICVREFCKVIVLFLICLGLSASFAMEVRADPSQQKSDFSLTVAPYVWVTALKGEAGAHGVTSDVDISMGDVVDAFDMGGMFAVEARYKRWSLNTDFIWASLSDSSPTPKGIAFSDAKLGIDQIIWTQAVGYSLVDSKTASLELLGGFRLIASDVDLDLQGATLPSRAGSKDKSWMDPVIGARSSLDLSDSVFVTMIGDIGGFGVASDLTWQALGQLGYRVSDSGSLCGGYRAIGYDYNRDNFIYDIDMHGPF